MFNFSKVTFSIVHDDQRAFAFSWSSNCWHKHNCRALPRQQNRIIQNPSTNIQYVAVNNAEKQEWSIFTEI